MASLTNLVPWSKTSFTVLTSSAMFQKCTFMNNFMFRFEQHLSTISINIRQCTLKVCIGLTLDHFWVHSLSFDC